MLFCKCWFLYSRWVVVVNLPITVVFNYEVNFYFCNLNSGHYYIYICMYVIAFFIKQTLFEMFKKPMQEGLLMYVSKHSTQKELCTIAMQRQYWKERVRELRQPRMTMEIGRSLCEREMKFVLLQLHRGCSGAATHPLDALWRSDTYFFLFFYA